ncbi:MAG: trkA [Thermoleophilia bacterium]|nr:trkA [Thermoleophilia bacterium]
MPCVHDAGDDIDDFFQAGDDADASAESQAPQLRSLPPRLGMLADLTDDEFDHVARAAKLAMVEADTVVFRQGDEADRFFILVDGGVDVERDGEVLATLGPGAFFGESALLVRGARSATVTTIAASSLWSVSYEAFDAAMSHHLLADEVRGAEAERRIAETPEAAFEGSAEA